MYPRSMARLIQALTLAAAPATAALGQWTAIHMHPGGNYESSIFAVTATVQGGEYLRTPVPPGPFHVNALLWSGSPSSWTSLAPAAPLSNSAVLGIDGSTQVGTYIGAALWHGTPESRIDLAPPGVGSSSARAVRNNMQVGAFSTLGPNSVPHASLWRGTPESFIDLHPSWASASQGYATDGVLQGGAIYLGAPGTQGNAHAALWNGTPESVIDLNPPGMTSEIFGMAPGLQVGMAKGIGNMRAAVWNGSVESYVNFHPPGDPGASWFTATTGSIHVGRWTYGPGGFGRAAINFGTPKSWLGLHDLLPPTSPPSPWPPPSTRTETPSTSAATPSTT